MNIKESFRKLNKKLNRVKKKLKDFRQMTTKQELESYFALALYITMGLLLLAILILLFTKGFETSTFIALSALTASIAMTRSVLATKISDETKANIELSKERLEAYAEINRIVLIALENKKYSQEDNEKIYKIYIKSSYLFSDEIKKFLGSILTLLEPLNSEKQLLGIQTFASLGYASYQDRLIKQVKTLKEAQKQLPLKFNKYLELE